jgi:hypothetical protein
MIRLCSCRRLDGAERQEERREREKTSETSSSDLFSPFHQPHPLQTIRQHQPPPSKNIKNYTTPSLGSRKQGREGELQST